MKRRVELGLIAILSVAFGMHLVSPSASDHPAWDAGGLLAAESLMIGQTATRLADGRWLLLGGDGPNGPVAEATLWNAQSEERTPLPTALQFARSGHTATVLPDGRILILGGTDADGQLVEQAELFNPGSSRFTLA